MNFSTIVNKGLTRKLGMTTLVILFTSIERFGFLPTSLFKELNVLTLYVAPVGPCSLFHLKPVLIVRSFKK